VLTLRARTGRQLLWTGADPWKKSYRVDLSLVSDHREHGMEPLIGDPTADARMSGLEHFLQMASSPWNAVVLPTFRVIGSGSPRAESGEESGVLKTLKCHRGHV